MKHTLICLIALVTILAGCGNPCKEAPCQNGGECIKGECDCPNGWVGEQCEYKACYVLACQNGGECVLGECQCPPGFYGEACEFSLTNRFIGTYAANQDCQPPGGPVSNSQYTLLCTEGGNDLEVNLFLGSWGWVTADVVNYDSLVIPDQMRTFGRFEGGGRFINDSTLVLNYSNYDEVCVATLIKQ